MKSGSDGKPFGGLAVPIFCFICLILIFCKNNGFAQPLESIPENLRPEANKLVENRISSGDVTMLTGQLMNAGSDQGTILKIYALMQSAIDQELPVEPILNKAFEGLAKQIPPPQIAAALEKVLARYGHAYRETERAIPVPKADRVKLGNLAAESMAAGLLSESLQEILNTLKSESSGRKGSGMNELAHTTLMSARDMARLGTPSQSINSVLTRALQCGATADDMRQLREHFMLKSRTNRPDKLAANLMKEFQNHRRGDPMNIPGMMQGDRMKGVTKSESEKGFGQGHGNTSGEEGGGGSGDGSGNSGGDSGGSGGSGGAGGESGGGSGGGSSGGGDSGGSGGSGGGRK